MTQTPENISKALLLAAQKAGADGADVLVVDGKNVSIEVREGALEHAERAEGADLGLRVFVGRRQACVSASDIRQATLEQMVERAVAMAKEAPEDPYCGLADADQLSQNWDAGVLELLDPEAAPEAAILQDRAARAEAAALGNKGVSKVQGASAEWGRSDITLATSGGFSGSYARTSHSTSCVAISGEGSSMERDWCGEGRIFGADLPSPEEIGLLAAERAVARSGARKPPTGSYPVLFDERVSSTLIGHLLSAINGVSIVRGSSWLADAMDSQVLPENYSLVENPHRVRSSGSKPFDAEGLASRKNTFVGNGMLRSWVLDLATGRSLGLASTGNAARGVGGPPSPSVGNLELVGPTRSKMDIIRDMGEGLLVTSLIGSTISATTGDYSRGASGFWIKNGEITGPVNECTIASNLRDMLMGIQAADDARMHLSRVIPSLFVGDMIIAGG